MKKKFQNKAKPVKAIPVLHRESERLEPQVTHPGSGGAAAGLGQQPPCSLVFIILGFQLHSSQPDLLTVGVSLTQQETHTKLYWNDYFREMQGADTQFNLLHPFFVIFD